MTLTEARKTLERYRPTIPDDELGEAIDTAISALPKDTSRPTAAERVAKVRADLERHGLDPFKDKSRRMKTVAMRHCVFLMLRREGYTQRELGDATGYDHSTVSWGEAHARDLVNIGDNLYTEVWNRINMIDEGII